MSSSVVQDKIVHNTIFTEIANADYRERVYVLPNEFARIANEIVKGATFLSFVAATPVDLNKKNRETKELCPYMEVVKIQRVKSAGLGWDYETRYRKVTSDEEFQVGPHAWKAGDYGHFIFNKDLNLYMPVHVLKWGSSKYRATFNGKRDYISKDALKPYMAVSKPGDNPTGIRSYTVANLRTVKMMNKTFVIETESRQARRVARQRLFHGAIPLAV